jgi:parallel beta-helix repeat protein
MPTIFDYGPKAAAPNLHLPTNWTNYNVASADDMNTISDAITGMRVSVKDNPHNAVGNGIANDATAIQGALDAAKNAGGGLVYVPPGTYLIQAALKIGSNVTLQLSAGATIKRGAAIDPMLRGDGDGVATGYSQLSNILVTGGIWDVNAAGFASAGTGLAFAHITGLTIRDTTIKNCYQRPNIHLAGAKRVKLLDCRFETTADGSSGMVAIEQTKNATGFPFYGPDDDTPCTDIELRGCSFNDGEYGIRSGAVVTTSVRHTNIRVIGCDFQDMDQTAIHIAHWSDSKVVECHLEDCARGIEAAQSADTLCRGLVISDNTLKNFRRSGTEASARGIVLNEAGSSFRAYQDVTISGNTLIDIGRHSITFDYSDVVTCVGNTIRNAGGAVAGTGLAISLVGSSNCNIVGNNIIQAYSVGIRVDGATSHGINNTVVGNIIHKPGNSGISILGSASRSVISGNTVRESGLGGNLGSGSGIDVTDGGRIVISNNNIHDGQEHGIILTGASQCAVVGNIIYDHGKRTNVTYDGIHLAGSSDANNIQGNRIHRGFSGNQMRYGINVSVAGCDINVVTNNDLENSGGTGSLNNAGTGTVTAAGNRL